MSGFGRQAFFVDAVDGPFSRLWAKGPAMFSRIRTILGLHLYVYRDMCLCMYIHIYVWDRGGGVGTSDPLATRLFSSSDPLATRLFRCRCSRDLQQSLSRLRPRWRGKPGSWAARRWRCLARFRPHRRSDPLATRFFRCRCSRANHHCPLLCEQGGQQYVSLYIHKHACVCVWCVCVCVYI